MTDEHGPDAPDGEPSRHPEHVMRLVETGKQHGVDMTAEEVAAAIDSVRALQAVSEGKAGFASETERLLAAQNRQRRYLPTFADLVDRLSIVQLKEIFITDHAAEYRAERELIQHDIDLMLSQGIFLHADAVRSIMLIMLTNRYIWENETKARAGGPDQDRLLKLTHSINGVRNAAKNELARAVGDSRLDYKVDCFAADLVAEFGNWNVLGQDDDPAALDRG